MQRLDRAWYDFDGGYDETNNPFANIPEEYTRKKEEKLTKSTVKRMSAQQRQINKVCVEDEPTHIQYTICMYMYMYVHVHCIYYTCTCMPVACCILPEELTDLVVHVSRISLSITLNFALLTIATYNVHVHVL